MILLVGKHSGFCFGVKRAVEIASKEALNSTVFTYGNIIHNESVVEELKKKNVFPVNGLDSLKNGDKLIIRAHGAPKDTFRQCEEMGISVTDATCPFVKRIHNLVQKAGQEGKFVYIVGKSEHPEIIGITGHASGSYYVIEKVEDVMTAPVHQNACVVAQTTLNEKVYKSIVSKLREMMPDIEICNTICDTTRLRQTEAAIIASRADRVYVLGSTNSANTMRLYEICKSECKNVEIIEDFGKFCLANLKSDDIIGIVAGASTPDRMIREVIEVMSEQEKTTIETIEAEAPAEAVVATTEETQEVVETAAKTEAPAKEAAAKKAEEVDDSASFAEAFEKTLTRLRGGQVLTGTVLQIVDGEVYVNVGYKSDGIIPKTEYSADPEAKPEDDFKEGDEIEVEVLKVNDGEGNVLLSRKNVENKRLWDELLNSDDVEGKVFEAVAKDVVKGGIIADINGVRAFVPASQASLKYTENLQEFVGKPMKLKVLEVDKQRKRIVASQKAVLVDEQKAAKKEKWNELVVGSKVKGIVRRITDFGAFVDIGGIDGLVHVTDAGWGRVKHTSDVLSIGQEIEVLILNVDAEKERISLGYKQLQPKPWTLAAEKYPIGTIVEGKVVRIVPFGAFVALESTIDGLIHVSQVGIHRVEKVEDELKVGDIVRCKVLEVNPEAKRISLSRKEALIEEDPDIARQVEEEKAERERIHQERMEQRAKEREAQQAAIEAKRQAKEKAAAENTERRGRRKSDDDEYELPPIETATTSLASLLSGLKTED